MGHALGFPSFAGEDPEGATGFWCFDYTVPYIPKERAASTFFRILWFHL